MNSLNHRFCLTILVTCLFLAISFSSVFAADTIRLKKEIVPTFQTINLKIDARETDFSGSVAIDLEVRQTTNGFIFHAEDIELNKVILRNDDTELDYTLEKGEKGRITLTTNNQLKRGSYKLEIDFTTSYNTQAVGLYRTEADGENYLFTQFEESDARKAFPCFDEPAFKFPYLIKLTVPAEHIAVSNTPVADETTADGWKTYTFEETKPLPTYLLAIATGPLETVEVPDMPIPTRVVTVKGKTHMADQVMITTPIILDELVNYFGRPYPYKKLDLIAVPEFWPGAMENAGAITFRQSLLLMDQAVSVSQLRRQVSVMAHELAHMWFGDLVTMEWWDDLWLNESFATWMGNKVSHTAYPDYGLGINSVRSGLGAMVGDARPTAIAIRPPEGETADLLRNIGAIYGKGQAVLSMIENWVGEEAFRQGVVNYVNENAWGNATSSDLWNALSNVSGKNVDSVLGTFIVQPGVPLVSVSAGEDNKIILSQRRFSNYEVEVPSQTWQIPINLKYFDGQSVKQKSVLLTEPEQVISLDTKKTPKWIFPNASASGYYRWQVSKDMLVSLMADADEHLNSSERIGLLSNLSALLDAGEIKGSDFLQALSLFADDPDPAVIRSLTSSLYKVESAFTPDELKSVFATYVNHLLMPSLERLGIEAKEGENEEEALLRPSIIGWLADEGENEEVRSYLKTQAKKYLEDPSSIDPSLAGVSIYNYAKDGDGTLFEEFKSRFENAKIPAVRSRFLWALGQFRDSALIDQALDYTLKGQLYPQEIFSIPFGISGISEKHDHFVFDWFIDNYDVLLSKIPKAYASRMVFIAGGCSKEKLKIAREFFTDEARLAEGTHEQLARVAAQVNDCVNLRAREGESVAEYLRNFANANK
jgi:alanyl aminopeptidase